MEETTSRRKYEDNIKMYHKEIGYLIVDRM
jgi:hypothetical protein